jgi:hypothetical protein
MNPVTVAASAPPRYPPKFWMEPRDAVQWAGAAPRADYTVWVRGYGLIDSRKMRAKPGQRLDLAAAPAPSAADAAHYYPAIYWYSLLTIPDKKEFGGENGIPANATQQGDSRRRIGS